MLSLDEGIERSLALADLRDGLVTLHAIHLALSTARTFAELAALAPLVAGPFGAPLAAVGVWVIAIDSQFNVLPGAFPSISGAAVERHDRLVLAWEAGDAAAYGRAVASATVVLTGLPAASATPFNEFVANASQLVEDIVDDAKIAGAGLGGLAVILGIAWVAK